LQTSQKVRSLARSIARSLALGPVSLVALHACTHSGVLFYFIFGIAKISMIHRKDLAESGHKLHTKVEFSLKHPLMFLASILEP
jgi:hypothetical protein